MKSRNILILAVLVIALIAVKLFQNRSHERTTAASDTVAVLDAQFDIADINRVVLGFEADSTAVVLERLPDNWVARTAHDHPVAEARINSLLNEINGLRGEFRSDNADVLSDYGLGADSPKLRITLYGSEWEKIFDLDVGEKSERGAGSFIKRPGSDTVFLTRANILGQMGLYSGPAMPQTRHFLDLEVFSCQREDITAINLYQGESVLAMEKVYADPEPIIDADGNSTPGEIDYGVWEWALVQPERKPLAKTKVDAIANAVANIRAKDVDDPMVNLDTYGLWRAERRVEIALRDGTEMELRFGNLRESEDAAKAGYWMMTTQGRTIWVIDSWKADQIFKSLEDLLPDLPESPEETS